MQELLAQIISQLRGVWRHRWHAFISTCFVCLAGWSYVFALPDFYVASARVEFDTDSALEPLLQGLALETAINSEVDVITQALLSRPNLEKLLHEENLGVTVDTPIALDYWVNNLQSKIIIRRDLRNENIYTFAYSDQDPHRTYGIVSGLLNTLTDIINISEPVETAAAQSFLEEQVEVHEQRLIAAEKQLSDFQKKNVGMMPSDGRGYYEKLDAATKELAETRAELRVAENRRKELRRQITGEEPVFGLMTSNTNNQKSSSQDREIQEHRDKLADLSLRYTDKHPEIVALKDIIFTLEKRSEKKRQMLGTGGSLAQDVNLNPVFQSMKIALSEAEVEVAALRAQYVNQKRRVEELKSLVDTIPEVEARLKQLTRNYEITSERYNALVQRLETARLSGEAEQSREDVEFEVIETPQELEYPAGPNRKLFNTVVLIMGLISGLALAFFLHQLRPVFSDSKFLQEETGLPLLGSVSMKVGPGQRLKSRAHLALFLLAVGFLACLYGAVLLQEATTLRVVHSLIDLSRSML